MYGYNYGSGSRKSPSPVPPSLAHDARSADATQGYTPNPAFVPPPGFVTAAPAPVPGQASAPVPFPVPTPTHTPTPIAPVLPPVQVPPGCYPIELVQFWRDEYKRGQPFPLHWALFVRTAPAPARARPGRRATTTPATPRGNFYELVGNTDTYTAQFLSSASGFEPEALPDWRGTHVIGWVHPAQLGVFERAVRQVQVWRQRPDWRCQQWVYEVMRAVGGQHDHGVFVEQVTFVLLQRHMGRLLEAWENGDI